MPDVTLEHLNPADLIVADNVRLDPRLDNELIRSIKARGVLTTIDGWRDDDGVHVLRGQRRTLAAIEAGIASVPVAVAATQPDEADRLVDQWVENEHRAALTNRERVTAVEQMALVGLSEAQIAKRTGSKRDSVKAALEASKSDVSTEFSDMLTLEQAAALAEFDDDGEAVEALVNAAGRGQFDHLLSRLRQRRADAEAVAAEAERLRAEGHTVLDTPPPQLYARFDPEQPVRLDRLTDTDDRADLDRDEHAANCPGHAYYIEITEDRRYVSRQDGTVLTGDEMDDRLEAESDARWQQARTNAEDGPVDAEILSAIEALSADDLGFTEQWIRQPQCDAACTEATRHRDRFTYAGPGVNDRKRAADMTDEERETAKIERRRVIDNNAAWRAAEPIRREWLTGFASRKTAPKGAEAYIAGRALTIQQGSWDALPAIGLDRSALQAELTTCTPKRATQIALCVYLAGWESTTGVHTWRNPSELDRETLRLLNGWGYTLSDIETETTEDSTADTKS